MASLIDYEVMDLIYNCPTANLIHVSACSCCIMYMCVHVHIHVHVLIGLSIVTIDGASVHVHLCLWWGDTCVWWCRCLTSEVYTCTYLYMHV